VRGVRARGRAKPLVKVPLVLFALQLLLMDALLLDKVFRFSQRHVFFFVGENFQGAFF